MVSSRQRYLTTEQQDLATRYVPFARKLAHIWKNIYPYLWEEFDSAVLVSLVELAFDWNPFLGVKFVTYARPRLWGALQDVVRHQRRFGYRFCPVGQPRLMSLTPGDEEVGTVLLAQSEFEVGEELETVDLIEKIFSCLPPRNRLVCRLVYQHGKEPKEVCFLTGLSLRQFYYIQKQSIEMLSKNSYANLLK